ncbi:NAD(P)H-binding protein [Microbacterium lacticum]|nr:NAD(P)H-binding protein [Microbacterium lacticum]
MRKLVVCGADGNFGAIAADTLLSLVPAERVRVAAPTVEGTSRYRDAGVDTAVTNFNDTAGLTAAFEGAEKVLVISMPFVGPKRRDAHRNAVDACIAAGVSQIVYVSLVNATDPTNPSIEKIDHAWTEAYIQASGIDYVFLRNSQYAEAMITAYFASLPQGEMANNAGDGRMSFISRRDCATAAAYALANRFLHTEVSSAPFSSEGMVTFGQAIREGKMAVHTDDFRMITGRRPITVRDMFALSDEFQVGARHSVDA